MRRKNQRNIVSDSSEENSDSGSEAADSDVTIPNSKTSNKKQASPKRKRGRLPVASKNKKRQRLRDDSDSDASPQPSTSSFTDQQNDSLEETDKDSCDSTSADSDYGPVKGKNVRKRKNPHGKGGRLPKVSDNSKKRKVQNNSVNGNASPQPNTSAVTNHESDSQEETEKGSSDSESADSDYGPVRDRSLKNTRTSPREKKGRLHGRIDSKKQKAKNNAANDVSSQKRSCLNRLNSSSKKSSSNDIAFDTKQVEILAQKLAYFLLIEDQKKYAIKRKAITTHVFKDEAYTPKLYSAVIKKANFILKKTYGMELMELENQKDSYLIVNILGRELSIHDYIEVPRLKQQQHGLILYLLTVIYMNENAITEDELTRSLKILGIDLTSKKLHPVFGDVKKYITSELVRQMYLNYQCISKEPVKYEITWGVRAKQEFDKRDLLQFACQIMDDTTPENWRIQFKDAEKSANPKENGNV